MDLRNTDSGFVRHLDRDPMNPAIVEAIERMGQAAGLQGIAQRVQEACLGQTLPRVGVDPAQGYGQHRPKSMKGAARGAIVAWVRREHVLTAIPAPAGV